jgi:hypothetical protein
LGTSRRTTVVAWPWPQKADPGLSRDLDKYNIDITALESEEPDPDDAHLVSLGDGSRVFVLYNPFPEEGVQEHAEVIELLKAAGLNVFAEGDGREGSWGEVVWYPATGEAEEFDTIERRIAVTTAEVFTELEQAGCSDTDLADVPDQTLATAVRTLFARPAPLPPAVKAAVDQVASDAEQRFAGR